MYTSTQILSFKMYSDLFPEDPGKAKLLLRRLQKEWHPDKNSNTSAHDVFIHIMKLYQMSNPVSYSGPEYTRMDGATAKFKSVCSVVLSFCTVWYSDYKKLSEVIVSILQVQNGANAKDVVNSWSGDTSLVVSKAVTGIVPSTGHGGLVRF